MQSSKQVREQSDAVGHAVRAVYLYTGMADLAEGIPVRVVHQMWQG